MNVNGQPPRPFTIQELADMKTLKQDTTTGHPEFEYEDGLKHGRDQLLSEIYTLIYYDNHPTHCSCDPCNVRESLRTGRMPLLIIDDSTSQAAKTKIRQALLRPDIEDTQPDLQFKKDPDCSV